MALDNGLDGALSLRLEDGCSCLQDRQSATKRYETDSQLSSGQCFVEGFDGVVASPDWYQVYYT